jgi:16S rRNA (guanine527-N7)-methyltransferase
MSAEPNPLESGSGPAPVLRNPSLFAGSASVVVIPTVDAYGPAQFQAQSGASDLQMEDLARFRSLLFEWNARMNLVGPSAEAEFWSRHVLDSAQLLIHQPQALSFADLGAGAGFPGIVLACLLKGRPGAKMQLIESMAKRCRFLSEVVGQLALPATVRQARAEDLQLKVQVVTARACAPMVRLLGYAEPYLKQGAVGLFLKGQDIEAELKEAAKSWCFDASLYPSLSHPQGRVVALQRVSRV